MNIKMLTSVHNAHNKNKNNNDSNNKKGIAQLHLSAVLIKMQHNRNYVV